MRSEMPRHINIPVFIVHMGCPNQCVFCDQRLISGESCFSETNVQRDIDACLASVPTDVKPEIAFFGGSFTGIDRSLMIRLLDLAQSYVKRGAVSGIRMSTRPDYITEEIVGILSRYTVSAVELGIQSFSDPVLAACRRGHTAETSRKACALLRENGFSFAAQMMIGLPGASYADELACAEQCCALGASAYRIYPTIVFRHTELESMMLRGEYIPLTVEDAVQRMAGVMEIFEYSGVRCLRAGLCESGNLHDPSSYAAGPNHPAIGELARGELFYRRMEQELLRAGALRGKKAVFYVPRGCASLCAGQNRRNILRLKKNHAINSVKIIENNSLIGYNIILET